MLNYKNLIVNFDSILQN